VHVHRVEAKNTFLRRMMAFTLVSLHCFLHIAYAAFGHESEDGSVYVYQARKRQGTYAHLGIKAWIFN
jgi:hypothetical protein